MVLNRRGDYVVAALDNSEDCEIVTFRPAAGEYHFRRPATQHGRNALPCPLHRRPGVLAVMMYGRGIPKLLDKVGMHRLQHLWQQRRGSVIVHIHAAHSLILALSIRFNANTK